MKDTRRNPKRTKTRGGGFLTSPSPLPCCNGVDDMATPFIALQCCRCSTMQVKQQRKSGSKWVCAICNQRQSVRQIHARGPIARDLRKFVQDFNMARAGIMVDGPDPVFPRTDGSGALSDSGGARDGGISSCGYPLSSARKRTDWSEYLDPIDDGKDQDDGSREGEAVTELPWAKRRRIESSNRKSRFSIKPESDAEGRRRIQESKGCSSTKWSEYLEEEGDAKESLHPGGGDLLDPDNFYQDATSQEVAVEEEVHPDFI